MPASRIFRTDRPDRRFKDTAGFIHYCLKNMKPVLSFNPDISAEAFTEWQGKVRDKLRELMKLPEITGQPLPKLLWDKHRDGYSLQKWEIYPENGSVVPFLMLVPDKATEDNPGAAVLCFSGSQSSKELLAGEPELNINKKSLFPAHNRMAEHYVKQGIVSVAVENPGTGELELSEDKEPVKVDEERDIICAHLIHAGRNYLGLSVFQKLKILEFVKSLEFVDSGRIAVSGHSLGAELAMVLGVLCPEIKAMVFNDALGYAREYAVVGGLPRMGLWHLVPDFLSWFDFPDLLAAFAPRHLIISEGGRTPHLNIVSKAYKIMDAESNFKIYYHPKYAKAEARKHDFEEVPEGLTREEYLEYANVDTPEKHHYFKEDFAVPWLSEVL